MMSDPCWSTTELQQKEKNVILVLLVSLHFRPLLICLFIGQSAE